MSQFSSIGSEMRKGGSRLRYCRAYRISELARFAAWPAGLASDREIAYLHEDLRITLDPSGDPLDGIDASAPAWQIFCRSDLKFSVPDDVPSAGSGIA